MTAPPLWQQSPEEQERFRQQEMARIMAIAQAFGGMQAQQRQQTAGLPMQPPSDFQQLGQQAQAQQGLLTYQGVPDTELLGQARFWGIPEEVAMQMPREELERIIQENRMKAGSEPSSFLGDVATGFLGLASRFTLGIGQGVTGGLTRLPWIGENAAKWEWRQKSDAWLNEMEEGVRASMPYGTQTLGGVAEFAGQTAALWIPGNAAFRLAGAAGAAVPAIVAARITSPIIRMAAQGGAAAWLLEGGSEHPAMAVAGGAVLGGAAPAVGAAVARYGPSIAAATRRVASKFGFAGAENVRTADPLRLMRGEPVAGSQDATGAWRAGAADVREPLALPPASTETQLRAILDDPVSTPEAKQSAAAILQEMGMLERPATQVVRPDVNVLPSSGQVFEMPAVQRAALDGPQPFGTEDLMAARGGFRAFGDVPQNPGFTPEEAMAAAVQMNKAGTIIDSPQLSRAAGLVDLDEVTVAQAAMNSNPGGVNLVQGIPDPARFMAGVQASLPEGMNLGFARRGQRLDAIISDQPITDEMIGQYERFGVFTSQRVLTAKGREAVVVGIEGETAVLANPLKPNLKFRTPVDRLSPMPTSPGSQQVEGLYETFTAYANQRVAATSEAMGGAISPDRMMQLRQEHLPQYLEEFLEEAGVTSLAQKARLRQYVNERLVEDYTRLAPEESALQAAMEVTNAADAGVPEFVGGTAAPRSVRGLEDLAASKGFMAVPEGGTGSWSLVDMTQAGQGGQPTEIVVNSVEAAEEFLKGVARELPDVTPPADVPIEVADLLPTTSHLEPTLDNSRLEESVIEQIDDLVAEIESPDLAFGGGAGADEANPGIGGYIRQLAYEARGQGIGALHQAWEYAFASLQPMRRRFAEIDQKLTERGLGNLRIWEDYDNLNTALVRKHDYERPWLQEWAGIMSNFSSKQLNSGRVTQLYEIEDDVARVMMAEKEGFTPRQIAALEEMNGFFRKIFPETGLDNAREIRRYISHIRKRQSVGHAQPFEDFPLNQATQPFYEHMRLGSLQARELDARVLGNTYVRALAFDKHMKVQYNTALEKWQALRKLPEFASPHEGGTHMADVMLNWMQILRRGHDASNDRVLNALHSVLTPFMPGLTKAQSREIFSMGMSGTHSALMGWRPDVLFRDSIQMILATPRVGTQLFQSMGAWSNPANRAAMVRRAQEHGWAAFGKPRIAEPGAFETTIEGGEALGNVGGLGRPIRAVYEAMESILPRSMRGVSGTKIHPMYAYTKLGEHMRVIVGDAGYMRAAKALAEFRKTGDFDKLLGDSAARTFDQAIRRRFTEIVASGDDNAAAGFIGRQLADATLFQYGMTANPEAGRSVMGRIGLQMGSFSMNYYQYLRESLRNGTAGDKVKFLAISGAVAKTIDVAKEASGWQFDKWQFHNALAFTGGPWLQTAAQVLSSANAAARIATAPEGVDTSRQQRELATNGGAFDILMRQFNPLAGGIGTVGAINQALDSPDPGEALARWAVTGERGTGKDWSEWMNQNMGMQSGPVRGAGYQAPVPPPPSATHGLPQEVWDSLPDDAKRAVDPTYTPVGDSLLLGGPRTNPLQGAPGARHPGVPAGGGGATF